MPEVIRRRPLPLMGRASARTLLVATGCALVMHVLWIEFLAGSGGDLAAQDAWTSFVVAHPTSAYDLAWYGGMHPASYSLISPYVMGLLGVRLTMLLVGTMSTALVTFMLGRLPAVTNPVWAGIYAAIALTGNAISGRVTFGLGIAFGLGALVLVFAWPHGETPSGRLRWVRGALVFGLAALATAASPVAGLFLGLVASALWLRGRRSASLALGVAPVIVVAATAVVFPFFGCSRSPGRWPCCRWPWRVPGGSCSRVRGGCLAFCAPYTPLQSSWSGWCPRPSGPMSRGCPSCSAESPSWPRPREGGGRRPPRSASDVLRAGCCSALRS